MRNQQQEGSPRGRLTQRLNDDPSELGSPRQQARCRCSPKEYHHEGLALNEADRFSDSTSRVAQRWNDD